MSFFISRPPIILSTLSQPSTSSLGSSTISKEISKLDEPVEYVLEDLDRMEEVEEFDMDTHELVEPDDELINPENDLPKKLEAFFQATCEFPIRNLRKNPKPKYNDDRYVFTGSGSPAIECSPLYYIAM